MKLKVGGLYLTKNGHMVKITEYAADAQIHYDFQGWFVKSTDPHSDIWTENGAYDINGPYSLDLIEEITDPVLLAFYG